MFIIKPVISPYYSYSGHYRNCEEDVSRFISYYIDQLIQHLIYIRQSTKYPSQHSKLASHRKAGKLSRGVAVVIMKQFVEGDNKSHCAG